MISIKGLSKGEVLAALYNASRPRELGFLRSIPNAMTAEEGAALIAESSKNTPQDDLKAPYLNRPEIYFDYLNGRAMKVDLSGDEEFSETLYDRDNGEGAAQRAIDAI